MSDNREIIEVEDYRVIDVREEPIPDSEPVSPPPHTQQWSGEIYTSSGGGGCCLSMSATILLIGFIFLLGMCAFVLIIARLIGWAIPGL